MNSLSHRIPITMNSALAKKDSFCLELAQLVHRQKQSLFSQTESISLRNTARQGVQL
jgi:hypothetical protein